MKVKLTQMLEVLTCMIVWEILNNAGKSAYSIWENGGVICKRANAMNITAYLLLRNIFVNIYIC